MKKIQILLLIICVFALEASAQNNPPKKETIIIGDFSFNRSVPASFAQTIRNNVLVGFVTKGRFSVVDSETDATLKVLNANRSIGVTGAINETYSATYKSMGAKYIIIGDATQYTCTVTVSPEGIGYETNIYVSLKAYSILTGETIVAEQFKLQGFGKTGPEADASASSSIELQMNKYIDKNFKFLTKIIRLDEMKKGKVKTLYINAGSQIGVKVGDSFLVYKEEDMGGFSSNIEIGKLRVVSITNPTVAKCKVVNGGDVICKEFDKGSVIIVESLSRGILAGMGF